MFCVTKIILFPRIVLYFNCQIYSTTLFYEVEWKTLFSWGDIYLKYTATYVGWRRFFFIKKEWKLSERCFWRFCIKNTNLHSSCEVHRWGTLKPPTHFSAAGSLTIRLLVFPIKSSEISLRCTDIKTHLTGTKTYRNNKKAW